MFTRFTLTLVTIILMIALAGCGAKTTPTPSNENSQSNGSETYTGTNSVDNNQMLPIISGNEVNIQLNAKADGTTQQVKKGEIVAITLESNPSTGYGWYIKISDPKVITQLEETQFQEPSPSSSTPLLGAAGMQTFLLQAVETGTATITLEYKRSWETTVAPEKTIIIVVEVK
jgi:inhibitor of cysteine peptidase